MREGSVFLHGADSAGGYFLRKGGGEMRNPFWRQSGEVAAGILGGALARLKFYPLGKTAHWYELRYNAS